MSGDVTQDEPGNEVLTQDQAKYRPHRLLRGQPSRGRGRAGLPRARRVLADGGDADRPRHALSTVVNLVSGEPGAVAREESEELLLDARRPARLFLESLPPERYPRLVEAATPLSEGVDSDAYLAFGLDLLLAGIEAMAVRKR